MKRHNRINLDSERVVPPQPATWHHGRDRRHKGPAGRCRTCGIPAPYLRPWCLDHAALHDPHVAEVLEQTGPLEPAREVTRG